MYDEACEANAVLYAWCMYMLNRDSLLVVPMQEVGSMNAVARLLAAKGSNREEHADEKMWMMRAVRGYQRQKVGGMEWKVSQ